jgi:hypothetical protein
MWGMIVFSKILCGGNIDFSGGHLICGTLGFCRGGEHSSFLTMGRNSMIGGLRV